MIEFIYNHLATSLCVALFIARVGDVLSTYLVTPTLKLESNPLVRKFQWPFAIVTIPICLVPYYNIAVAIPILVISLLVSASNCSKIWLSRAIGEREMHELMKSCAQKAPVVASLLFILSPCLFILMLGGLLLLFYPDPMRDWGFYIAIGIIGYAFALGIYGPLFFLRLRKLGQRDATKSNESCNARPNPN